jgi:TPR repeat protein
MEPAGTQSFRSDLRPPAVANRRRCVRQRVHTPAYASMRGKSSAIVLDLNEILDISEAGMSFQCPTQMEFGSSLDFYLDLSETQAYLPASGKVVWSDPSGRTGVSFLKISGPSLMRLREWLFLNALTAGVNYMAAQGQMAIPEVPELPARTSDLALGQVVTRLETAQDASASPPNDALAALAAVRRDAEQMGTELELCLQLIAERTLTLTGATGAAIAISDGADVVCRACAGFDAPPLGARVQAGSGFSGECMRTGLLLQCDDAETDSRVDRDSCRFLGVRSLMAAPVCSGEIVVGLLEVFSSQPGAFGDSDRFLLVHLAEIVLESVQRAVDAEAARRRLSEASVRFAEAQAGGAASVGGQAGAVDALRFQARSSDLASVSSAPAIAPEEPQNLRPVRVPAVGRILALAAVVLVLGAGTVFFVHANRNGSPAPAQQPAETPVAALPAAAAAVPDLQNLQHLAEQGDATAQFALGAHFATGDGVGQDYPQAVHWFSLAAGQGHVVAQATLGAYYWAGRGVPQDLQKAYFWSALARSGGDEASKYRLAALASRMSQRDVAAAQKQADEWLTQHHQSASNASNPVR